jgi:hypothetical protein
VGSGGRTLLHGRLPGSTQRRPTQYQGCRHAWCHVSHRILARREPRAASACRPKAPSIHRRRATTTCREGKGARPEATGRGGVPRDTRDDPALVSREGRRQVRRHRPAGSWASARARRRGRAAVDHGAREPIVGLYAPSRRAPERGPGPRTLDDSADPERTRHRARAPARQDHAVEDVPEKRTGAPSRRQTFSASKCSPSAVSCATWCCS